MEATGSVDEKLADALRQYDAARFSGVLQVEGQPGGTIYLTDGRISGCETSGAPSLEVLLLRSRTVSEPDWDAAFTAAAVNERLMTDELTERALLGAGELEALLRVALADAMFALVSGRVDGWTEAAAVNCALPLSPPARSGWLLAEAARRGQALAAFTAPAIGAQDRIAAAPDLARPGHVLSHGQEELLAVADGRRTPRDLAFALGRGLYETMLQLSRMRADNVVLVTSPGKESTSPGRAATAAPDKGQEDQTATGLPRRRKDRPSATPRGTETGRRNLTAIRMLWPRSEESTLPGGAQ
jgi:hypothetical protein